MNINTIPTPTPPTKQELVKMRKKQQIAKQERLLTYDDRIVQAKLHYFKGSISSVGNHLIIREQFADEKLGWNSVVMVGTERQMAADDTIDNTLPPLVTILLFFKAVPA